MERLSLHSLLVFAALSVAHGLKSQVTGPYQQKLSPPLTDAKSDKKFFGPPFPADYPDDKRPVPQKDILDMVKSPGRAYPALQGREEFDSDFVKDENHDAGAWEAQFEYDHLRRDLQKAEQDQKRAQDRADREGQDVDGAQHDDDSAAGRVNDAQKEFDKDMHGEEDIKKAEDFEGPPSDEKLKEIRKAIKDAEDRYAQAQKNFLKCKAELDAAKKELDDLRAQQKEMEEKLAADTKLWAEQKAIKMNLKKARQSEAVTKVQAAMDKLAAAEKVKADAEKVLAKEKAEHEAAKKKQQKEKAEYEEVHKRLGTASARLQKIHGFKPVQAVPEPVATKSSARMLSLAAALPLSILAAMCF